MISSTTELQKLMFVIDPNPMIFQGDVDLGYIPQVQKNQLGISTVP